MSTSDNDFLKILQNSKCYNCKHRLTRIIEPLTLEDMEYYNDMVDIDTLDAYDIVVAQHKCMLTGDDLGGVVLQCSKFEPINKYILLHNYEF